MVTKPDVRSKLLASKVWANLVEVDCYSDGRFVFQCVRESGDTSPEIRINYRSNPKAPVCCAFVFTEDQEESPRWNEGVYSFLMMSSNFMNWLANSFPELSHLHQANRPRDDAFEVEWGARPLEVLTDTAGRFGLG